MRWSWVGALALATGCTGPADRVPDGLSLADGPVLSGAPDQIVDAIQRRAKWVPRGLHFEEGAWVHSAGGIRAEYSDHVVLGDRGIGDWAVGLELVGFGRGDALGPVQTPSVSAWDTRVSLDRGGIVEWYENRGEALKQGFDLAEEPDGSGPVVLEMTVTGDLAPTGQDALVFNGADGSARFWIEGLEVFDAKGRHLPAHMEADCSVACVVRYVIDDTSAHWPIHVDPVVHGNVASLDSVFAGGPGFGGAQMDISGDRMIVAVPGDPAIQVATGFAVILTRNGVNADEWALEAQLSVAVNDFARAVAIDGDVAVVGSIEADSIYIYERDATGWGAPTVRAEGGSQLGASVDVSGDFIVAGAPAYAAYDGMAFVSGSGGAYAYDRASGWVGTLVVPATLVENQRFGSTVALDGKHFAATLPNLSGIGELHLFERDASGTYMAQPVAEFPTAEPVGSGIAMHDGMLVADLPGFSLSDFLYVSRPDTGDVWFIESPPSCSSFGKNVATDGRTIAAAAFDDSPTGPEARVWLFELQNGSDWQIVDSIEVPDAGGVLPTVAMADGFLAVGKPGLGANGEVSVYRQDGTWVEDNFSPGGTAPGSRAGHAVAIARDRMAVGLPYDDTLGTEAGLVTVLERNDVGAPGWFTSGGLLTDPAPASDRRFGSSLDMHGHWIAVGAPGNGGAAGSAHLYEGTALAHSYNGSPGEEAGSDVAVGEGLFAVGSPGSSEVHVFQPGLLGWSASSYSPLDDPGFPFGTSVDIDGHRIATGDPRYAFLCGSNCGRVELFDGRDGAELDNAIGSDGEELGVDVEVLRDTVFAGIPGVAGGGVRKLVFDGSAFDGGNDLLFDPGTTERFGRSVAASRDRLLVGSDANRVRLYEQNSGGPDAWGFITELNAASAAAGDEYGHAVAIDERSAAVGSPGRGPDAGRVTVFELDEQFDPVLVDDAYTVQEDGTLNVDVTLNDFDANGDAFTVEVAPPVPPGSFSFTDGVVVWTPDQDFFGQLSFDYQIEGDPSERATVTLDVTPVNDAPELVGAPPVFVVDEDTPFSPATSLLDLFDDPDSPGFTLTQETSPVHGTLDFFDGATGLFQYTPDPDVCDEVDSFDFRPDDGDVGGVGAVVTVQLDIQCINDPPEVANRMFVVDEGDVLVEPAPGLLDGVTDVEGNGFFVESDPVLYPTAGTVFLGTNGSFSYRPFVNTGATVDQFTVRVTDDDLVMPESAQMVVSITINPANEAPVAVDDAYGVDEDGSFSGTNPRLVDNDFDPDGDLLTITKETDPVSGATLILNADGSFTYTAFPDFSGDDLFTYRIDDGNEFDIGTVMIEVRAINDAPVAADDTYDNIDRSGVLIDPYAGVLVNDSDVDGDLLHATVTSSPSDGALDFLPDGSFEYIPDPDHLGTDEFRYIVSDGLLTSNEATVTLITDAPTTGGTTDTGTVPGTGDDCPLWLPDSDGDGFGDQVEPIESCEEPANSVEIPRNPPEDFPYDCNDDAATENPDADEIPDDGVDQNCDGEDAVISAAGDCGCSTSPTHPVLFAWLPLLVWRRRC